MNNSNERNVQSQKTLPNFLFIMTDEQRFPPAYENDKIKQWRKEYLIAENQLRKYGFEFLNHYTGSAACAPARATLFTGQYPSLHGVTQTDGAAKNAFDPEMFWLDANTVPTMGDYFRCAGYRTFYKGKWHISHEDIIIPGTKDSLPSYDPNTGVPDIHNTTIYKSADRLNKFGWHGWIGPEPHGTDAHNSGSSAEEGISGRDVVYTSEIVSILNNLNKSNNDIPWLLVASLVNPHDITLYGELTKRLPNFNFTIDDSVPNIPKAPTADENLSTKPDCQQDYKDKYQIGFQPTIDSEDYRRLYYSLTLTADRNIQKILKSLKQTRFFDNTIIVFTSDHGDYLGAHGLYQKWYSAYDEAIHVPLIIKPPNNIQFKKENTLELTSSVDVLPTLFGLAGININEIQKKLKLSYSEVHPFVGRDLSPLISGVGTLDRINEPIIFMTDDDVLRGLDQTDFAGRSYTAVIQPTHIRTIITKIKGKIYKFTRYFDDPNFWSDPNVKDVQTIKSDDITLNENGIGVNITTVKTEPMPDQYELYNLTDDPFEHKNLINDNKNETIKNNLLGLLSKYVDLKLLKPKSLNFIPPIKQKIPRPS